MRKYLKVSSLIFRQRLAIIFEYRANFIMRIVAGFIAFLFTIAVWQGLRPNDFQAAIWQFYVIAGLVGAFTGEGFYRQMSSDINSGQLSFYLLQNFPYLGRMTARLVSDGIVNIAITIITILLVGLFSRGIINLDAFALVMAIPFLILGRVISVLINFLAGCVSFLWINPDAFYLALDVTLFFFFGSFVPFWLLPPFWQNFFLLMPFRSVIATPTEVALGMEQGLWVKLTSAVVWLVLLSFISQRIWKRILVYYESVGG